MKLLFASRNRGKTAEVSRLLEGSGWELVSLLEAGGDLELAETGATFEENARLKARQAAERLKLPALADDSGLEVDALGGEPGVHSARYAGPGATDADRTRLLLDRLIAVPDGKRSARFRCVMCLAYPAGEERLFEGRVEGSISHHARGTAGFGYDPVFIPAGESRTFAELGLAVKNRMSHRAEAARAVFEYLKSRAPQAGTGGKPARGGPAGRLDKTIPGDLLLLH